MHLGKGRLHPRTRPGLQADLFRAWTRWPPPNDDVEDLDEVNDSWAIEVSGITEQEVQEQVGFYPDEVRGVMQHGAATLPMANI